MSHAPPGPRMGGGRPASRVRPVRRRWAPVVAGLAAVLAVLPPGEAALPEAGAASRSARSPAPPVEPPPSSGDHSPPASAVGGHESAEGLRLVAQEDAGNGGGSAGGGGGDGACRSGAPLRRYDIAAIDVDITLNRYLDHDPEGRMYVLQSDVERVRSEERQNEAARAGQGEPAVSVGLQGDAIQPLTLRVRQGECLRIRLRNDLAGGVPASVHLHAAGLVVAGTGRAAVAGEPRALARAGATVAYEWMVGTGEAEGTHYFHSHGDTRAQTGHGLFGAVIVEPAGSTWIDPVTGDEATGWAAVVQGPDGGAFRESVLYYHEIGNENYQFRDRAGGLVPLVDPITTAYRPGARALNYRSEPFLNRLSLQQALQGRPDVSLSYSSYAFGDPATPLPRSYVGDPVKQRVVHAGSETFHVHHVHGGAVRWRRQPGVEDGRLDAGLDKRPPVRVSASERTDSQSVGPSETFDVEHECGAGGCQQAAGDFMYHCHVSQHYFAGMWGIWRVYNTLQDGPASTDGLAPLLALPDRRKALAPAVESSALAGTTVDWSGKSFRIGTGDGLAAWVEGQLPPRGVPRGYDASVMDWARDGDRYLNEPETDQVWPGYRARAPGERPPLRFDPATGKLAFPLLRPHLGRRPPFAPGHGPAPFLDPGGDGVTPPAPGASGPASLCPAGTKPKRLAINAVNVPIPQNTRENLVDPNGQLFVLRSQRDAVLAPGGRREPLAVRANAGEHCVDVLLRSELADGPLEPLSKVDIHVHFVQFDVQASDGVVSGFGYEQAVRPYRAEGEVVAAPSAAGAASVRLAAADRFQAGAVVGVGMDQDERFEVRRIAAVDGPVVTFDQPLSHAHGAGEVVSAEFVRYRWYPDTQVGTAFFHEHVNPIVTGRHGLFGALVVEPPGATYHDPRTGEVIESGAIADIHSREPVSVDVAGSFRELVMFVQDDNPLARVGRSTGSAFNLRVEPVERRGRDPSLRFSSREVGDPETPLLEAYLGDPLVVRDLVASNNEVHTWHLDGHWFRTEASSRSSPPTSTAHLGISERFDLVVPAAGGPQRMPGDYLYYSGRSFKLHEGSWGILRVRDGADRQGLRTLPGHEDVPAAATAVCPRGVPEKRFAVAAVEAPLPMLNGGLGKVFVLEADRAGVVSGAAPPQPLVLHVNDGDCIRVELANATPGPVSFHADLLAFDPMDSAGVAAGRNPPQAVPPGERRTSTFYAHPEVGETVALVRDWGDVLTNPGLGLYGAVVVGPRGARFRDPVTGQDASSTSSWRVDVLPTDGPAYRDFTLFFQDEDEGLGNHRMPYTTEVRGTVGLNYRAEPLVDRLRSNPDPGVVYASAVHGDPDTPVLEAAAGDGVRLHVLAPWSEQSQVFSVEGHRWPVEPAREGTPPVGSVKLGGMEALTLHLDGGAGGPAQLSGDYLYGAHREPYREAGLWGILRVREEPGSGAGPRLLALPCAGADCPGGAGGGFAPWFSLAAFAALLALGLAAGSRGARVSRP